MNCMNDAYSLTVVVFMVARLSVFAVCVLQFLRLSLLEINGPDAVEFRGSAVLPTRCGQNGICTYR
jgi:hypothetical protein